MEAIAVDTAVNMGLFRALGESSTTSKTAEELAQACNAELNFTQRLLRLLSAHGDVLETVYDGVGRFSPTKQTLWFASRAGTAASHFLFEFLTPGWIRLPHKLKANNYRSLTSSTDTVFSEAYDLPGKTLWEILPLTPYGPDGAITMGEAAFTPDTRSWLEFYPAEDRLVKGANSRSDAVLFVDVGGYTGTQASLLKARFPQAPGRFIVEDLPAVLSANVLAPGVEGHPHDFFTAQPIKGARCYFMRWISHDWADDRYLQILSHLREAMTPGYSKLIINDFVMPEQGADMLHTALDFNMMSFGGAEERTASRQRECIAAAGLSVVGIWDPDDPVSESVIECEVPGM